MEQRTRILREPECLALTGLSRTTRFHSWKKGDFPAPVRLTARASGWYEHEVLEWLANRRRLGAATGAPEAA
jgi:prophage regulatory protein